MTSRSSLLVFTINYLLRSVLVFQPSWKVLLFWFSSAWCKSFLHLESILGTWHWEEGCSYWQLWCHSKSIPVWLGRIRVPDSEEKRMELPSSVARAWPWACAEMCLWSLLMFTFVHGFAGSKAGHRVMWYRILGRQGLWISFVIPPKSTLIPYRVPSYQVAIQIHVFP